MPDSDSILIFIIVSFCFALVLIIKKNSLDARFKRPLAIMALVMVCISFVLLMYVFLHR